MHADAPDRGQDEEAVVEPHAAPILREGEGVGALAPRAAGEAGLLAVLHPAEEGVIGPVQAGQYVLQHRAMERGVVRERRANGLDLCFLLVTRDGDTASLPGGDALLHGAGVAAAAAPEHLLQPP